MSHFQRFTRSATVLCGIVLAASYGVRAQSPGLDKSPAARKQKAPALARVSLAPRFVPGETFRYRMEFETTTDTKRSGLALDPQGPSSVVVDWSAAVRMDILPADASTPGGIRLRTTYEKSTASVRSDTFDPAADETIAQYHNLEGKAVEITLDAAGKVKYVAGLEAIADSEKAVQAAREWIGQLSASAGAPLAGVSIGETWTSEQPADSLPIAGLVWRTDSQYLRNESCHPPNPDVPNPEAAADPAASSQATKDCAVILANLSLGRSKASRDPTPPDLRKRGVESAGKWTGSAQSLVYVSLANGFVVSVTQSATQQMDVTLTSPQNTSMRYSGTISSRSQISLLAGDAAGK